MSYTTITKPVTRKRLYGALSVFGDALGNDLVTRRDGIGFITIHAPGVVAVKGGIPATFNKKSIHVFGLGGEDRLSGRGGAGALFGGRDTVVPGEGRR